MWGFLAEAIARRLPEKRNILMASFALSDAKRVELLFRGAGFVNVSVTREVRSGAINDLDEYWEPILAGIGSIPQAYLLLEESERRNVREEVSARLSEFVVGNELHLNVEMLICHGQASPDADRPTQSIMSLPAPIDPRLGTILVCPKTKEALEYDVLANELISRRAGLSFPIRDGIPIMLLDAARPVN
jgi:uncharacterized protein YbaR (Trm112 family)